MIVNAVQQFARDVSIGLMTLIATRDGYFWLRDGLCSILLAGLLPGVASAATRAVPTQYPTIQAAIDAAQPLDVVVVEPGTYTENLTLRSQVDVVGREAARTLLEPQSSLLPTVRIRLANDVRFSGFTLIDSVTGIEVVGSLDVQITNVVFESVLGIGVDADDADLDIVNNVFFANVLAIRRDTVAVSVTNNIFRRNRDTISSDDLLVNNNLGVEANCWSENADLLPGGIDAGYGTRVTLGNPQFVAETERDFHLQQGSPCIDAGLGTDVLDNTIADAGAYGGAFADVQPLPPATLTLTDATAGGVVAVTAAWPANASYLVTHSTLPGGYRVHYKQNVPGAPYTGTDAGSGQQPSPIDAGNVTTLTLTNLAPVRPRAQPTQLLTATAQNEAVVVAWQAVADASGYRIHYGVDSTTETYVDAGNVTSVAVTGLANGTFYRFAVGTLTRATYYVAVTARDSTPAQHESGFSPESSIQVGDAEEAVLSNELTARPELTAAYPMLPDEGGCFIATAAYGAEWDPEVQALRDFRDRYLLTHVAGRWLVARYYALSPAAADYIREHPLLKPIVRSFLMPLVVAALFLLGGPPASKMMVAALLAALLLERRRRTVRRRELDVNPC